MQGLWLINTIFYLSLPKGEIIILKNNHQTIWKTLKAEIFINNCIIIEMSGPKERYNYLLENKKQFSLQWI